MDLISLSLLLHLTKVKDWQVSFLHTYLCSSPSPSPSSTPVALCSLTKEADPHGWLGTCAGLIWITVPWWRGMLRLRLGECVAMRRVRGRLKSPDPEKESRWQRELPHLWTAPVPPVHPFLGSHSTSVQKTPWELWSGRMSKCWACTRSIRSQGACWLLCNAEHKNLADTILVYDPLCPIVALQQTCD